MVLCCCKFVFVFAISTHSALLDLMIRCTDLLVSTVGAVIVHLLVSTVGAVIVHSRFSTPSEISVTNCQTRKSVGRLCMC